MRAPVYRNAEAKTTLAGLAFPAEVLLVLAVLWIAMLTLEINAAALVTVGVYALIRAVHHGKPDNHLQHTVNFQARRLLCRGHLSAAARARTPRCPYGPYLTRDAARRTP